MSKLHKMKRDVVVCREVYGGGNYHLSFKKPVRKTEFTGWQSNSWFITALCPRAFPKWLGIKIPPSKAHKMLIRGELEVRFRMKEVIK